jgi:hypothetical protein
MSQIKVNTNRVDIPFTKNNSLQFTSLAGLVSPKAVGVLLEERNNDIGNNHVISKAIPDLFLAQENPLNFFAYGTHIVGFHGPFGQGLFLRGFNATSNIYIRAELFAGDFVFRSTSNTPSLEKTFVDGQVNQWIDKTVTPLGKHTVSDIAGVIITRTTTSVVSWGVRTKGSTDPFVIMDLHFGAAGTEVVGLDSNGQYQLYAGGKDGDPDAFNAKYWETGYILNDGMRYITNPVAESIVNTGGFPVSIDLSGTVEPESTHAIVSWRNGSTLVRTGHMRPFDSTDPSTSMAVSDKGRVTNIVPLTDEGLAKYTTSSLSARPFVYAYLKAIPTASVNLKGRNIHIKGGTMHIGRGQL